MRLSRAPALLFFYSLLPLQLAAQSTRTTSPAPQRDAQAVATVQTAIAALGGASAIGQAETWAFQASMQGPRANGDIQYNLSTDTDTGSFIRTDGTTVPAPPIHSFFVPALAGALLANQLNNAKYSITYQGSSSLNSEQVAVVAFSSGPLPGTGQVWYFDSSTHLPVRVDFRRSAQIGARISEIGLVELSDFRPVNGVLYPFSIVYPMRFVVGPAETVTLTSVAPTSTATSCAFNGPAGDLQ